jgi:hypothetical protein
LMRALSRRWSVGEMEMDFPVRIAQNRTRLNRRESQNGLNRQIWSTRNEENPILALWNRLQPLSPLRDKLCWSRLSGQTGADPPRKRRNMVRGPGAHYDPRGTVAMFGAPWLNGH